MKIRQGFKFRLEPTPEQRQLFARFAGSCRFVYNKLLSLNDERYQDARFALNTPKIPEYVGHGLLKLWKQSDEYGWLRETYSQCLQQAVKDLERAYTNLFEGRADAPTKRKKFKNDSCRFPQGFDVKDNQVKFPKIGWVRFTKSREILGTIKNLTFPYCGFSKYWCRFPADTP